MNADLIQSAPTSVFDSEPRLPNRAVTKLASVEQPQDVDVEARTVVATITTQDVDRDREVVLTDGLDVGSLEQNGVVLYMHDPFTIVGRALWVRKMKRKIVAKTKFADTPFADEVFKLYAGGFIRGWSIGMDFMTIKRRRPTEQEIRRNPSWANAEAVVESADVFEYSAVSIPANRNALNKAWKAGLIKRTERYFDRVLSGHDPTIRPIDNLSVVTEVVEIR